MDNWLPVYCRAHGEGQAFALIDYSYNVNLVFVCRLNGGVVKHFLSDDVLIYANPMDGKGWDVNIPEDWKPKTEIG